MIRRRVIRGLGPESSTIVSDQLLIITHTLCAIIDMLTTYYSYGQARTRQDRHETRTKDEIRHP